MLQTFDAIMQPLITRVYLLHKTKKYKGLLTFYSVSYTHLTLPTICSV